MKETTVNSVNNRITWINGLKGIACLVVFFHHFFLSFYPAVYFGKEVESKTLTGIDVIMGYKPVGVILNGNFAVCMFIMISSFLFAVKTMKADAEGKKEDLLNVCLQRYLRLMPPVAIASVAYYVLLLVLGVNGLNFTTVQSELSVSELIQHILFYQWITYDASLIGPLWCMYIIFLGSFIAIFLSKLTRKDRKYMPLLYFVISGALMFIKLEYVAVGFGVLLADIYCNERIRVKKALGYVSGICLMLCGLFLGGYPSHAVPENPVYTIFSKLPGNVTLAHALGAMVIILGIMLLPETKILSSRVFEFIGNISFSIYLLHSIVINLLSYFFTDFFAERTGNYTLGVWISFGLTLLILIPASFAYYELVEKKISKLTKKIHI